MPHLRCLLSFALSLLFSLSLFTAGGLAQTAPRATGAVAGRVVSADGDASLERVRVTLEGTSLETFILGSVSPFFFGR